MKYIFVLIMLVFFFSACNDTPKSSEVETEDTTSLKPVFKSTIFNEDNAFEYVKAQVDFGPRVPGTPAHTTCHAYYTKHFKALADTVYFQNSTARTFDNTLIPIKNIIASFNPTASKRIILAAHWDTRPFADQDTKDQNKPILGANDGASGVGVLMEIANVLKENKIDIGIDIILFDSEDWGDNSGKVEDSYCLGSQYWAKNPHVPNYKADFGILLDMVGAPNAMFGYESYSLNDAREYLTIIWDAAANAGYGSYFRNSPRGYVLDDHYYVMKYTGIPMVDIIDFDPTTSSQFGKYWHTHNDNMDMIDKKTLKAVGQTVLNVIYNY
ncbi:MAG: M28 family peptidase [Bacteroidota bacterium]|nr:M28 family peptidase [Bacteroidota bacterium]